MVNTVQAFRADAGRLGESESVFEKCSNIFLQEIQNFIETFNCYNSRTSAWISMKIEENEYRSMPNTVVYC